VGFIYVADESLNGNDVMACVFLFAQSTDGAVEFTSFCEANEIE
jgi:hypothetical protein